MTLMTDGTQSDSTASQGEQKQEASASAADTSKQQEGSKGSESTNEQKAGAPEAYADFVVPEGKALPEGLGEDIKSLAKELNLTQEQAQKLADMGLKHSGTASEKQAAALEALHTEWITSAKADKEFGGDKFDANLAIAKRAMTAFATPEFTELLNATGLGNHPEMIRLFFRAGSQISEDGKFVSASRAADTPPGATPFIQDANTMYPNHQR